MGSYDDGVMCHAWDDGVMGSWGHAVMGSWGHDIVVME